MTLYEVLQVNESASPEIIRAAYLALAKKYHPDLCKENPEKAAESMKTVNAAYEILSDPVKRNQYDMYLSNQRKQQQEPCPGRYTSYSTSRPSETVGKAESLYRRKEDLSFFKAMLILGISLLIIPLLLAIYSDSDRESSSQEHDTAQTAPSILPVDEPYSGTILYGYEPYYASEITVTASRNSSCVVKLKNLSGSDELCFYVRAGETATVGVPGKTLEVYFASGDTWYGEDHLFGEDTYYSKDDTPLDFENYTWEYTLYPVTSGNFSETPIDAEQFFD